MLANFYASSFHSLTLKEVREVSICLATYADLDLLRMWKNENTQSFFHKAKISASQQKRWFSRYLLRGDEYMFIALINQKIRFGCLGCRYSEAEGWDIYNVINGSSATRGRGFMSVALQQLISFCQCKPQAPITLKVLANNKAHLWYEKNGFVTRQTNADFILMEYDRG